MARDLSFESACQIVKGEYPELVKDIDKFAGIVLTAGTAIAAIPIAAAVGPTVLTPAAIILTAVGTLSNLLGVKNEILAISEHIIAKVTSKRDKDTLKMFERMQQAYTLTCYTSFFEALYRDKELAPLLKKIKMTGEEKCNTAMYAAKDLLGKDSTKTNDTEMGWLKFVIDLPQPGDTFEAQRKLLSPLYQLLANRVKKFFELVQPRGNSAGGKGMIEYRAKHSEGDVPYALSASKTASCQPLATRASAADGSAPDECPTTRQARSHHPASSQRNEQHQDRGAPAGRL
jgi:hypothetical protein